MQKINKCPYFKVEQLGLEYANGGVGNNVALRFAHHWERVGYQGGVREEMSL